MQAELTNLGQSAVESLQAIATDGVFISDESPKSGFNNKSILLDKKMTQKMALQLLTYVSTMWIAFSVTKLFQWTS